MSELQTRFIDDTYVEYYNTGKHELAQVYLKSEADKVIAEKDEEIYNIKYSRDEWAKACNQKDKEIQRLENLCESYRIDCDNLAIREANAYKDIERDNKQIRHQKYKRCLAMAKWCHNESLWWYSKGYGFEKYDKFWEKWEKRWLELAEKLKEAK